MTRPASTSANASGQATAFFLLVDPGRQRLLHDPATRTFQAGGHLIDPIGEREWNVCGQHFGFSLRHLESPLSEFDLTGTSPTTIPARWVATHHDVIRAGHAGVHFGANECLDVASASKDHRV